MKRNFWLLYSFDAAEVRVLLCDANVLVLKIQGRKKIGETAIPVKSASRSQFGRVMIAALPLVVVSCGGTSPSEVADAGDATDSAILDAVSEPDIDVGLQGGGFFCADPSSYFIEVKTAGGQNFRLIDPCQETAFGAPRFSAPRAATTVNSGPVVVSVCATQANRASISLFTRLTNFSGGSGTATGVWRDSSVPDAAETLLEGTFDLTRVGSLGDTIEGSYVLTSSSISISGSFRVCHVFDIVLTPP